ncbi:hypothetical protein PHPALM_30852 [Phytophthora palmivora]|uniref:Uncharacterized protein n=1 Tax=Phytophthora palmivora TaxID=4796 RepID=A0A2P4X419_9STRA|nr:hypothetical protein PHPALM_30852 [Phytophthora palmivora]
MYDQTSFTSAFLAELDAFLHADEEVVHFTQRQEKFDDVQSPICSADSPFFDSHEWNFTTEVEATSFPSSTSETQPLNKTTGKRKPMYEVEMARSKETKRRQMYRQRAKNERDSLRQEVTRLSEQLKYLTQASKRREKDHGHEDEVDSTSTWRALALLHRGELTQTNEERKRLLAAVRSQKLFIAKLKSTLHNNLMHGLAVQPTEACSMEKRKDMELYKAYLAELDSKHGQADHVFTKYGVSSMGEGVIKSIVKDSSDESVKYFRYRRRNVLPLRFDQASQLLWELTHLQHQQQDRQAYEVSNSDNSYAVKFRYTRDASSILHRLVVRQFITAECVVFVWKAFIEGEDAFNGMNSNESGWIRLRPSETGSTMEMYVNQVPMYFGSAQTCEATAAQFLEVVLTVGQESEEHVIHTLASMSLSDNSPSGDNCIEGSSNLNVLTKRLSTQQFIIRVGNCYRRFDDQLTATQNSIYTPSDHMTDLITTDEVLFDDIVGLLDFNGSLTPRLSLNGLERDTESLPASVFTQSIESPTDSSESSDKPDKVTNRREKEKKRQQRYRQRLKDSRDELQRQVDELSRELLQLSKKTTKNGKLASAALSSSRWIPEAVQQREQRVQSEAEQKRLIAAVNYQAGYIKGLRQAASNMLYGTDGRHGVDVDRIGCFNDTPMVHSMSSMLYTTYVEQLEGCYARFDRIMNACGMVTLPETTTYTTHRRKTDNEVSYFEHVNKVAIPFRYQQVCAALRTIIHEQEEPAFGGYEIAPDNEVFIKSRTLKVTDGFMTQRFVSRFYKEEERLVLVWKMSSEGDGAYSGLHSEQSAWMCVRPTPTGVMLEVCAQQVPMCFSATRGQEPAIDKFHKVMRESLEADKVEMSKNLERLLLDDVLTGIEC